MNRTMPRYERILPLVGITLMGLGLILLVEGINTLTFTLALPSGAVATVSIAWLVLFFLLILVALGTENIQREAEYAGMEDRPSGWRQPLHLGDWIMPLLITLTTFLFLRLLGSLSIRAIGLAIASMLLLGTFIAQHYRNDERPRLRRLSSYALDVLVHVNALFLYGAIYVLKLRSLFSATSLVLLSFLQAFVLLRWSPHGQQAASQEYTDSLPSTGRTEPAKRRNPLIYAAIVGLCVGEMTWPLNYWVVEGMVGGVFLLTIFYSLVNLSRHHLQGTLTRRIVFEYVLVGLLGFAAVGGFALLYRSV
jgi:hypothetical protein